MNRLAPGLFGCAALLAVACGGGSSDGDLGDSSAKSGAGGAPAAQGGGGRGGTATSAGMSGAGAAPAGGSSPQAGSANAGASGEVNSNAGTSGGGQGGTAGAGTGGNGGKLSSGGTGGVTGGTGGSSGTGGGSTGGGGSAPTNTYVYVGTGDFGKTGAGKVRGYSLNPTTLALTSIQSIASGTLPSFITIDDSGRGLFAGDEDTGEVRAFSINRQTGQLTALNSKSGSGHPVFLSVDHTGKYLLTANYNEGTVDVFGIQSNFDLGAVTTSGMQTGTQAHSVVLSPDNAYAFVPNKGSNYIAQFSFNANTGKLTANSPPNVMADGGPRHFAFHPSKPFAYTITENSSTLRAYSFDASKGVLMEVDSKSTLSGSSGNSTGGDVRVEPSGKFVYGSNRNGASSSLAIFSIDQSTGKLTFVKTEPTHGSTPRVFAISPDGTTLLVAHVDSSDVAAFRLNPATGALDFVGTTNVGDKAFCVIFLQVPR